MRKSSKLKKCTEGPALDVLDQLQVKLKEFQNYLPVITALSNSGLRKRHWHKINEILNIKSLDVISLNATLNLDITAHLTQIEEISESASKEYTLEKTLDKMRSDWDPISFELLSWRQTETYIISSVEEIQLLLDDQIIKIQSMRSSPYIQPFEHKLKELEKNLNKLQLILDQALSCQQVWIYLEPIFGSDDILQQMPNEGRKFRSVDTIWRRMMEQVLERPQVMSVCELDGILEQLEMANKVLEEVQKGLNDYLETKRLAFPRFYFLSNDELLEILSETKDPLRVQPYLKKIFEGIHKLQFEEDLTVTAMFSEENEKVMLDRTFNPRQSGGNVEKWLIECEAIMKSTVKKEIKNCLEAFLELPREEWAVSWPGQAIICVDSIMWTHEVEEAIKNNKLKEYAKKCTNDLMSIVDKVCSIKFKYN